MEATAFERKLSELDCPFKIEVIRRGSGRGGEMKTGRLSKARVDEARAELKRRMTGKERIRDFEDCDCTFGGHAEDCSGRGGGMKGRAKITREVKPGIEHTEDVWLEMEDATEEELDQLVRDYRAEVGGPRHWGIWHPEREEWWRAGMSVVFSTTSRAVALAQLQAARQLSAALDKKRWVVRCIEEWADEQHE